VQFREHTLDNGLKIIAECNQHSYSSALGFFVDTGSRDETDEIWGVTHFLEHMMFKGTPTRSALQVNRDLDSMGAQANASTSQERTTYYAAVLPEFQEPMTGLLADIMRPSLNEEDFDTEKGVILEEIQMYDDQPPYGAYDRALEHHFGKHPLSRSVLGTAESVTALTIEQMQTYFNQRYSPRNLTFAAAGKIDFDLLVEQLNNVCGGWEPFDAPRDKPRAGAGSGFHVLEKEQSTQQYVLQLANGPAAEDEDRIAARLLSTILGDDNGSRMYWELLDTGLADYCDVSSQEFQGAGVIATYLSCQPEQTEDILSRIQSIFQTVEKDGVSRDEIEQAVNKIASHIVLAAERPLSRLFAIGASWLQRGNYRTVRETIDSYDKVTVDDIAAVLEKYPLSQNTCLAVGPRADLSAV